MVRAISVRLDERSLRALRQLEATGLSRSEAIRSAILDAASRLARGDAIAEEVRRLEADDRDREEMGRVASLMEALRAPR